MDTNILIKNMCLDIMIILCIKGTVMQIEKAVINDRLCVSKVYRKFRIPTTDSFAVI